MANQLPDTGFTHLSKTALPLIGRVGTIAGGIVSLLAVFETLGSDALAASYFSRALQIDATSAHAQFGLGRAHLYLNNVNAAYNPLRTALQLNPNLIDAHAYLGFVYDYRSDFVRARAEYEEFLRVAPRDHNLRDDVTDRLRKLAGSGPYPTLTLIASPTVTTTKAMTPAGLTPPTPGK